MPVASVNKCALECVPLLTDQTPTSAGHTVAAQHSTSDAVGFAIKENELHLSWTERVTYCK
jgi:hypothetical protein